jgi:hypothetical protein
VMEVGVRERVAAETPRCQPACRVKSGDGFSLLFEGGWLVIRHAQILTWNGTAGEPPPISASRAVLRIAAGRRGR